MVETGWSPEEVGSRTLDQLLAVLKGIRRRAEMTWGAGEKKETSVEESTRKFEARVKAVKQATGRDALSLTEVL